MPVNMKDYKDPGNLKAAIFTLKLFRYVPTNISISHTVNHCVRIVINELERTCLKPP